MAPLTIYCGDTSPVSRAVVFLATYLKVDAQFKKLDLSGKEQYQDWYIKINPQHTVPTLVDGDLVLTQSRAILSYLATKSSAGSLLYPSDAKKKAKVDERLQFDATVTGARTSYLGRLVMYKGVTEVPADDKEYILEAFSYLNDYLKGNKWICGEQLSVADFAIAGSVSTFFYLNNSMDKFTEIKRWYGQFKGLEGFDKFAQGAETLAQFVSTKLPKGF